MSMIVLAEEDVEVTTRPTPPKPTGLKRPSRPLWKRFTHWIRRGHLYLGLFLVPWAVLYGFTGFLFNHPFSFRDTPNATYYRSALEGTPMASLPDATEQAKLVVAKLNEQQSPQPPYQLVGEATYSGRQTAFVTVKYQNLADKVLSVSFNLTHLAGGIHYEANRETKPVPKAPFTTGPAVPTGRGERGGGEAAPGGGRRGGSDRSSPPILLDDRIEDRIRATVPTLLQRTGFPPAGEFAVTTVPNLMFVIDCNGEKWKAQYNLLSGGISGVPDGPEPKPEMGWRRFLTQLHLAHVYPYEMNAMWIWSVLVDAMAFTMVFWALSGLIMWWQIKSTRKWGAIVLVFSALSTVALGAAMHVTMTS